MAWKYPSVCIRASNYGESFSSNDAAIIIYPDYKDLTVWRQAFRDVVQFVQSHPHNTGVGEVIPIGLSFGYVSSVTLILPQGKRWCFALIFLNGSLLNIWSLLCSIIHGEVFAARHPSRKYYNHVTWDLTDETMGGSMQCLLLAKRQANCDNDNG